MAGNREIHKHPKANTNGFDKNPQNIGGGRKKKIYTILKEKGYSADDVKTAFGELAFYTIPELGVVIKNEKLPVITRIVAKQFKEAFQDGNWGKIKEILEHVIGKPMQPTDVSIDVGKSGIAGFMPKGFDD